MAATPAMRLIRAIPANSPVLLYPTRAPWNAALAPVGPGLAPVEVEDPLNDGCAEESMGPPEPDPEAEPEAPVDLAVEPALPLDLFVLEGNAEPDPVAETLSPAASPGGNPVGDVRGVLAKPSKVVVPTESAANKVVGIPLLTVVWETQLEELGVL